MRLVDCGFRAGKYVRGYACTTVGCGAFGKSEEPAPAPASGPTVRVGPSKVRR